MQILIVAKLKKSDLLCKVLLKDGVVQTELKNLSQKEQELRPCLNVAQVINLLDGIVNWYLFIVGFKDRRT